MPARRAAKKRILKLPSKAAPVARPGALARGQRDRRPTPVARPSLSAQGLGDRRFPVLPVARLITFGRGRRDRQAGRARLAAKFGRKAISDGNNHRMNMPETMVDTNGHQR